MVEEEVDLGCTSTPELTCDAGTPGTLSAGVLGRFAELAHLLCICSAAASQQDLQICSMLLVLPTSYTSVLAARRTATFKFSSRNSEVDGWMTLDERHPTMWLRHAADGQPCPELGKTSDLRLSVWNSQILLTYGWT